MNSIYWIIVLAILILIEIFTLGVTTIWFAGGALAAFIVSLFMDNLLLEIILFLTVSLALLYFTRPILMNYIHPGTNDEDCNSIIGRDATVTATVDNRTTTGQVEVGGQEWSARSLEGNIIETGSRVKVQGVSGSKLIVTKT